MKVITEKKNKYGIEALKHMCLILGRVAVN